VAAILALDGHPGRPSRACPWLPRLPVLYRNPWRVIQGLWIWAASAPKPVEKPQGTFERAEAFAAALARDLERCAAIHAVMALELTSARKRSL